MAMCLVLRLTSVHTNQPSAGRLVSEVAVSVLVVEDDLDVRSILVESLREEGYSVQGAEHGQRALEMLAGEWQPQIILLDIMMPVMDGYAFLEKKKRDE